MSRITASMVDSFRDVEGYCYKSKPPSPCQHGPFFIKLKDGRTARADLNAFEIYSILKALKDRGVLHRQWHHFAQYTSPPKGWTIRPVDKILTEIFSSSLTG